MFPTIVLLSVFPGRILQDETGNWLGKESYSGHGHPTWILFPPLNVESKRVWFCALLLSILGDGVGESVTIKRVVARRGVTPVLRT